MTLHVLAAEMLQRSCCILHGGRQVLFTEGGLNGEILCRHLSVHIIEADLGAQRDAHVDGLKYT